MLAQQNTPVGDFQPSAPPHSICRPCPERPGEQSRAPGWGGGDARNTHSWLNMRFISSVMFMEPTSSSWNRFASVSCSEMSSSEVTLRSFFLGTTCAGEEEIQVTGGLCRNGGAGRAGKGASIPRADGVWLGPATPGGRDARVL